MAMMPAFGFVVRTQGRGLYVFPTPDIILIKNMSVFRVAWMVAVARAVAR